MSSDIVCNLAESHQVIGSDFELTNSVCVRILILCHHNELSIWSKNSIKVSSCSVEPWVQK